MSTETREPNTPKSEDNDNTGLSPADEKVKKSIEDTLRSRDPSGDSMVTEVRLRKIRRTSGDLNQMQKIFNGCAHFGKEHLGTLGTIGASDDGLIDKVASINSLDEKNKTAYNKMKLDIDRHDAERQKQEFHDYTEGMLIRCSEIDSLVKDARTTVFQSDTSFSIYKTVFEVHVEYAVKEIEGSSKNRTKKQGLGLGKQKKKFLGRLQQILATVEAQEESATTEYAIYFSERSEEIYTVIQSARQERANILSERFRNSFAQPEPAATGTEPVDADDVSAPTGDDAPAEAAVQPETLDRLYQVLNHDKHPDGKIPPFYKTIEELNKEESDQMFNLYDEGIYQQRVEFFSEDVVARIELENIDVTQMDSKELYRELTLIETYTAPGAPTGGPLEVDVNTESKTSNDDLDAPSTEVVSLGQNDLADFLEPGNIGVNDDEMIVLEEDLEAALIDADYEKDANYQPPKPDKWYTRKSLKALSIQIWESFKSHTPEVIEEPETELENTSGYIGTNPDGSTATPEEHDEEIEYEENLRLHEEENKEQPGDIGVDEDGHRVTPKDLSRERGLDSDEEEPSDHDSYADKIVKQALELIGDPDEDGTLGFDDENEKDTPSPARFIHLLGETPPRENFSPIGGRILAQEAAEQKELEDRENKGFYKGLGVATLAAVASGLTGIVIGAVTFGGEDLPEMNTHVGFNGATHAVKVKVPAREGDPAAYIRSELDELETLAEDNEKAERDYKGLKGSYDKLQTDYNNGVTEVAALKKKLESVGLIQTEVKEFFEKRLADLEARLGRQIKTIDMMGRVQEKLADEISEFYNVSSMGAYFKTGVSKSDIQRFFSEEVTEAMGNSKVDYRVFKTRDGLKIITASGKSNLIDTPEGFDKGLKRAKDRMFAIDTDVDNYLKKHGNIIITFTGLDVYEDIHRAIYKGTTLADPTRQQAKDMRRVIDEKLSAEDIQKMLYGRKPGDEITIGK